MPPRRGEQHATRPLLQRLGMLVCQSMHGHNVYHGAHGTCSSQCICGTAVGVHKRSSDHVWCGYTATHAIGVDCTCLLQAMPFQTSFLDCHRSQVACKLLSICRWFARAQLGSSDREGLGPLRCERWYSGGVQTNPPRKYAIVHHRSQSHALLREAESLVLTATGKRYVEQRRANPAHSEFTCMS